MLYEKEKNSIDATVQSLESALKKQEQTIKLQETQSTFFSVPMASLINQTLNKTYLPGIDIDVIMRNAYALSLSAVNRIQQAIKEDPKKLLIHSSIGIVVLGLVLKSFKSRKRNLKRKEGV